jgi:hypothetical protein
MPIFTFLELVQFAMRKLIGGKQINLKFTLEEQDCLAILRARLPFKVWRADFASELVASHMSWCTYISEDRHFVHSTVVSEPILADAATMWMSSTNYGYAHVILQKYMEMTMNGIVDIGKFGEHVAAIIFLLARDVAALKATRSLTTQKITVDCFLNCLLGSGTYNIIKKYISNEEKSICKGVITFSHFSYVNKTPTKKELLLLLSRGTAVLCKEMQKGIDLLIPVLMPNQHNEFILSSDFVTYILVQVKNYSSEVSDSKNRSIAQKMQTKEVGLESTIFDYLTINMNVGEKNAYCKTIMMNSKQKAIILGGIDDNIYPCLGSQNFFQQPINANVQDVPNDHFFHDDLEEIEQVKKWVLIC